MKAVFRVDASAQIGAGHVSRCLALADELAGHGVSIRFLCRDLPGHAGGSLNASGYRIDWLTALPDFDDIGSQEVDAIACGGLLDGEPPADWLIVDHYRLGAPWERAMRQHAKCLMVIDDLANREHVCDMLLDHNFVAGYEHRYEALVPDRCQCLLGPRYVLLRKEFDHVRSRRGDVVFPPHRLLVSFGGSDPTGETEKTLAALLDLAYPDIVCDVIVGEQNPRIEAIRRLAERVPGAVVHVQPKNMAEIVTMADLAIGACGVSALERCYVGVPQIVVVVVDNQVASAAALAEIGAVISLGRTEDVDVARIAGAIGDIFAHSTRVAELVAGCQRLFPPQVSPGRELIADAMMAVT